MVYSGSIPIKNFLLLSQLGQDPFNPNRKLLQAHFFVLGHSCLTHGSSSCPFDIFQRSSIHVKKKAAEAAADDREKRLQKATLLLQAKYGKNAVLKGMNLSEGGTTKLRNEQIGGHKA